MVVAFQNRLGGIFLDQGLVQKNQDGVWAYHYARE